MLFCGGVYVSSGNVLSIGDLLIFAGAFILLHHACASRLALRRPVRA